MLLAAILFAGILAVLQIGTVSGQSFPIPTSPCLSYCLGDNGSGCRPTDISCLCDNARIMVLNCVMVACPSTDLVGIQSVLDCGVGPSIIPSRTTITGSVTTQVATPAPPTTSLRSNSGVPSPQASSGSPAARSTSTTPRITAPVGSSTSAAAASSTAASSTAASSSAATTRIDAILIGPTAVFALLCAFAAAARFEF